MTTNAEQEVKARRNANSSTDQTTLTVQDCMAGAFQALLRGDTAERDRLCAMVERTMKGESVPSDTPIIMGKDGTQ